MAGEGMDGVGVAGEGVDGVGVAGEGVARVPPTDAGNGLLGVVLLTAFA